LVFELIYLFLFSKKLGCYSINQEFWIAKINKSADITTNHISEFVDLWAWLFEVHLIGALWMTSLGISPPRVGLQGQM
jgi:hypothetical protein